MSRTLIIQRLRSCNGRHAASCAEKLENGSRRVGKGALAPCPPCLSVDRRWWARFALPTLQEQSTRLRKPHRLGAAIDRKIPRADEDRARLQAVEAADRVAEMGGIGIADVLREMGHIEVLVGEVQQMPRALPGAEGAERDAGLFLEQMQETRSGKSGVRRACVRRHGLTREAADTGDCTRHAGVEHPARQRFAKTHLVEFGGGDVAVATLAQQRVGGEDLAGIDGLVGSGEPLGQDLDHAIRHALRLQRDADRGAIVAGNGMPLVRQGDEQLASGEGIIDRQMQAALDRDIDVTAAGGPLAGAAEQAGIEYPLRRDQHQMVGFATVIFHWDPPRAALWPLRTEVTLAEIWALSRRDSAIMKRKTAAVPTTRNSRQHGRPGFRQNDNQALTLGATFCSTPACCSAATAR